MEIGSFDSVETLSKIMSIEDLIIEIVSEEIMLTEKTVEEIFKDSSTRAKLHDIKSGYYKSGWENIYNEFIIESGERLYEVKDKQENNNRSGTETAAETKEVNENTTDTNTKEPIQGTKLSFISKIKSWIPRK